MFAYCGNNPVSRNDDGGEFWNIVIGAVVGGAIGAIGTALDGGTPNEILMSAACGVLSGGLAATGFGGLLGQIAIGAVTSAIDSGYQNYNEYAAGKKTLNQAVVGTLVDTAMGATFGAMGFEGTDALKASNIIVENTHAALKSLAAKTVHPTVKASAKAVLRKSGRYVLSEAKQNIIDNLVTGAINYGVGRMAEFYY